MLKQKFIQNNLKHCKDANEKVLNFIANFIYYQFNNGYVIYNQFKDAYCYHFAQILKNTFNRGEIYITIPFGHILWKDVDELYYDINGVYCNKNIDYYIPIDYLGESIKNWFEIPGEISDTSEDKIYMHECIREYLKDNPDKIIPKYEHLITKEEVEYHNNKIDELIKECKEKESKYGYYTHRLYDDGKINSLHTHGIMRNYSHMELESIIVTNLVESYNIVTFIADLFIKNNVVIKNNTEYNIPIYDIHSNKRIIKVTPKIVYNSDINISPYFRLVIADPNDKYPWDDDCKEEYKVQWTEQDQESHDKILNY